MKPVKIIETDADIKIIEKLEGSVPVITTGNENNPDSESLLKILRICWNYSKLQLYSIN